MGCCLGVLGELLVGMFARLTARCSETAVRGVTLRAHFFEIDGRVLGGMQFGILVHAGLFWDAVGGAV